MTSKSVKSRLLKQVDRWKLLSDDDGHYYLVPAQSEAKFYEWVESFQEDDSDADPDGYENFGAISVGCSPTCVSFTDPKVE